MQITGIASPFYLIFEMGAVPIIFSVGLVAFSALWYFYYARSRVARTGAIYHVFERLGRQRYHDLDTELRGILKEKGLREEDPFDEIVSRSLVFDLDDKASFEEVVTLIADQMHPRIHLATDEIIKQVMEGTRVGATPVTRGVALPHFRTDRIEQAEMALVRTRQGVSMPTYNPLTHEEEAEVRIQTIFFLVSPENNPTQHLRILARIAERVDEVSFAVEWDKARNEFELRECLLHDDHFISLSIHEHSSTAEMMHKPLRTVGIPKGCLVAMLARDGHSFVPNGGTILKEGDQLTIIGEERGLAKLKEAYPGSKQ
jgi:mannitol/fructose-specific phosphotransferase system IIA component (Ntr-type)